MASPNEVSLLQYARFHGIATEHTDIDPLQHIDGVCDIPPDFLHPLGDTFSVIEQTIASSQQVIEQNLHPEKLDIRKESVQFLSSVLRDIKRDNIDDCWDEVLPLWDRFDDLKLEPPLFSSDKDTNLVLPAEPLRYSREENLLGSHEGLASDYDSNFLSPLIHEADIIKKRVGNEKLDCSKDALLLIQGARQAGNRPLDLDDYLLCPLEDVVGVCFWGHLALLSFFSLKLTTGSPPLSSSDHFLLSPVRHDSAEVPTGVDTVYYEGCSRTENVPGSTISMLESEFDNQVFEGIDRQLSHDPSLIPSSPNERGPPDGMSPADMDMTNEKGFTSDFEQVIMAVTIPRSPSSITSRVTYTEITDNIATSDCFPNDNTIVKDLPSRRSYSPIPSACSSSRQEAYVQEFPDCSAESIIGTPVPELYLITPTIEDDHSVASCLPEALPQLYDNISPGNPLLCESRSHAAHYEGKSTFKTTPDYEPWLPITVHGD
ncbi:similar to An11g00590 [Aspergillus luchuensis IFO 4308]|nr:similar to An11g00590 [Aspergillus luchuensis IFO 4308]